MRLTFNTPLPRLNSIERAIIFGCGSMGGRAGSTKKQNIEKMIDETAQLWYFSLVFPFNDGIAPEHIERRLKSMPAKR